MLTRDAKRAYAVRARLLQDLGFTSYDAYLQSPLWRTIRQHVLDTHRYCYACDRPAKQVHHARYTVANLSGQNYRHLLAVCGRCHHACEFGWWGQKLSPSQSTWKLWRRKWLLWWWVWK